MRRTTSLILACLCVAGVAGPLESQVARHLAAPPGDILSGRLVLPAPGELAPASRVAVLAADWLPAGPGWVADLELPVERAGPLSVAVVGVGAEAWSVSLAEPGAAPLSDDGWSASGRARAWSGPVAPGDPQLARRVDVSAAQRGTWRLQITASGRRAPAPSHVVLRTAGEAVLSSHVATHQTLSDRPFAVLAELSGGARVVAAQVRVEVGGDAGTLALHDDGRHADGAAGDGVYGAWVGPLVSGRARLRVQLEGQTPAGVALVRTQDHLVTIEDPAVVLSGVVTGAVLDADRLAIDVGLFTFGVPRRLHLSAEVWGVDADGAFVPVAWLSHIGLPPETYGETRLQLHLDGRWLARAGTTSELVLRRVRVQDPDSHVVYDRLDSAPLAATALPPVSFGPQVPVTLPMLHGAPPTGGGPVGGAPDETLTGAALQRVPDAPLGSPALLLSHGYCSGGNIWPDAHFDEPKIEFVDPDAARSNDEFAQLLLAAGDAGGATSYGIVAHSQGGMAGLHLFTFYSSGLDEATGPRRIQTVATPYLGTPLASLGFFACGTVDDLTTGGAPTWLSTIPTWARQEVFYWTTQNSGSACSGLANLFLGNPNDGTVERDRGQLSGANSMGHVLGWCHTTGMSNPASYTDAARNAEMNALAAR